MLEIGANLYHTAVLFVIIWGITRFFGVLGGIAEQTERKARIRNKNETIKFTK